MGASNSKIEDDKALALCRERKRLVKQALDGRCVLAAAHVAYVQSLRNTGTALRKFVDPEADASAPPPDSSARVPYPSQQHADASNFSPSLSGRFQVNHMAAARIPSITIEERPPALLEASVQTLLSPSKSGPESDSHEVSFHVHHMKSGKAASATFEERPFTPVKANLRQLSEDNSLYDSPSPPSTLPWDYFGLANILDSQFSIDEGKALGRGLDDNTNDIKRLREEEGIPELEDGGEAASLLDRDDDSMGSGDDDFDQISEDLVQIYRNRNDGRSDPSANASHATPSAGSIPSENDKENRDNTVDETSEVKLWKSSATAIVLPMNVKEEHGSEGKPGGKDLTLCIKEIEILFLKASDSGGEVQRMLEANNLQFRPLFTEEKAYKWKASAFLSTCLACCKEGVHTSQAAAVPASNEMKYLTWHGSMSSRSSSSRIHLGAASKAEAEDLSSRFFGSACMNSGSHASTLDRLYAWERKLYDEVKASGFIRREYDLKCRQLRLQDSRAESAYRIDKTRAAVKDLHSRIRVAIHRINSISKSIEELRDKELQPQLEELIGGLTRMWEMMLECHAQQHRFIMESSKKEGEAAQSEPLRQATLILQIEMSSLCSSFAKWISALKSYLKAIHGWLLKCVLMAPAPKNKSSRRRQSQFSPRTDIAPPIFVTCRDWLALIDELPEKEVEDAMIDLIETAAFFLPRPEKANNSSLLSSSAFSLSRRAKVGGEKYEEIGRNREESAQWRFSYDSLQSGLVVFFDRLRSYADSSLVKYEALQKAIDEVRVRYENSDFRR